MNQSKKLFALLLSLVTLFSVVSPLFGAPSAAAETKLAEIKLTSSTTSVQPGSLPAFTVGTSTAAVQSIAEYSPSDSYWAIWAKNDTAWRGCNAQNPAVAVGDDITRYAMRVSVNLKSGYAFDEATKINFNGTDITSLGHTKIQAFTWGGYIYIDLGTAGAALPKYTLSYDANGGSGSMPSVTVYQGESISLDKCTFTPPAGLSFQAWKIGGTEYKKYTRYTPTANVTAKAVWTDKYIRDSRATMAPSALSNTICANDLKFTSSEPSKYTVALWRVFDVTDESLNTDNFQYPHNKKFVAGHKYALEFEYSAVGNYYQYDETDNISTFYLNGKTTGISNAVYLAGSTLRRVELTANEQTITQITATVTNPVAGNVPNSKPIISTNNVTFGDYDWYENGSTISKTYDSFQAGHTYRLKIRANTTKAISGAVTATINGKVATIESVAQNTILFSLDFTLPGGNYTVTFNANGGTGNMSPVTGVSGYYTLPSCGFTAPTGKRFQCWVVGGVEKNPYNTVNVTANTIVTAVWADKPHEHKYTLKYNEDYHWQECTCGQKVSFEEHVYDSEADATCNVCDYVRVAPHEHKYTLKYNEDYHWQECACGQKVEFKEHTCSAKKTVKPTATALGYTLQACSCGYSYKQMLAPTGKLTLQHVGRNASAVKVSWNSVKSAGGYQVQCSDGGTQWAQTKTGPKTSVTFSGLKAGVNYKFRVRFFIKAADGKNYYSPWSKTLNSPTRPGETDITKLTGAKKAFTAQWKKADFTGYQVQYSTNAKFTSAKKVTVWNTKTLKTTVKNLNANKTYYVRIRTFKTISNEHYFSYWSKSYSVKTK